ncbi:unnamed protein product [Closterium sp. Yama58-4]|nr:unnamed protein product [Closterium sp. Yama58-4]
MRRLMGRLNLGDPIWCGDTVTPLDSPSRARPPPLRHPLPLRVFLRFLLRHPLPLRYSLPLCVLLCPLRPSLSLRVLLRPFRHPLPLRVFLRLPLPTPSPSACSCASPSATPSPSACSCASPSATPSPSVCSCTSPSATPSPSACSCTSPSAPPSPSACSATSPTAFPSLSVRSPAAASPAAASPVSSVRASSTARFLSTPHLLSIAALLPNLRALNLEAPGDYTAESIERAARKFPRLTALALCSNSIDWETLSRLLTLLPSLQRLSLVSHCLVPLREHQQQEAELAAAEHRGGRARGSPDAAGNAAAAVETSQKSANAANAAEVADAADAAAARLAHLSSLAEAPPNANIPFSCASGSGSPLAPTFLHIARPPLQPLVTDAGVVALANGCTRLVQLSLGGCENVGPVALRQLARRCGRLEVLRLARTAVDDAAVVAALFGDSWRGGGVALNAAVGATAATSERTPETAARELAANTEKSTEEGSTQAVHVDGECEEQGAVPGEGVGHEEERIRGRGCLGLQEFRLRRLVVSPRVIAGDRWRGSKDGGSKDGGSKDGGSEGDMGMDGGRGSEGSGEIRFDSVELLRAGREVGTLLPRLVVTGRRTAEHVLPWDGFFGERQLVVVGGEEDESVISAEFHLFIHCNQDKLNIHYSLYALLPHSPMHCSPFPSCCFLTHPCVAPPYLIAASVLPHMQVPLPYPLLPYASSLSMLLIYQLRGQIFINL